MTERITRCRVSWKCLVACLPGEESQQPMWPQVMHSCSDTHSVPSFRHSSQAFGVRGAGKLASVRFLRCAYGLFIALTGRLRVVVGLCRSYLKSSGDDESVQGVKESLRSDGQ